MCMVQNGCCLPLLSSSLTKNIHFGPLWQGTVVQPSQVDTPRVGKSVTVLHYNTCFQGFQRPFAVVLKGSKWLCLLFFLPAHQPSLGKALAASCSISNLLFLIYHGLENQIINFCKMRAGEILLWVHFMSVCVTNIAMSLYTWWFSYFECLIINF